MIGCAICAFTHAPIQAYLLAWAAGTFVSFFYVARHRDLGPEQARPARGLRLVGPTSQGLPGVWRFAWATNFSSTVDVAFTHVLTLVVGAILGPAQAAYWRIGKQVADGMAKPAQADGAGPLSRTGQDARLRRQQAMSKLAHADRPDRRRCGRACCCWSASSAAGRS
jgi:hypothetical protein